jgi:hypothetical protein
LSFSFVLLLLPLEAKPLTFADGLVHVIDAANSFPFDQIVIEDGPGGATTTVNLVAGGEIATSLPGGAPAVIARNNSVFSMSGGTDLPPVVVHVLC